MAGYGIQPWPKARALRRHKYTRLPQFGPTVGPGGVVPVVEVDQLLQGEALPPTNGLKERFLREVPGIAETQVGNGNYVVRDAENPAELGELEDADPADADPLAAGSQPEVLDGQQVE